MKYDFTEPNNYGSLGSGGRRLPLVDTIAGRAGCCSLAAPAHGKVAGRSRGDHDHA